MARLIDADKLEKEMYHEAFETDSDLQKWDSGCWIRYRMFKDCIVKQPTIDAVEVVHGRWDDSFDGITPYCTACGRSHNCINRTPNYCPNCGAKMDGGDEE